MPLYRPPEPVARRATGDLPPRRESRVRKEYMPDLLTLRRQGIRSETDFIPRSRGEIFGSSKGDYILKEITIPTVTGTVTQVILGKNLGSGFVAIDETEDPDVITVNQQAQTVFEEEETNNESAPFNDVTEPETSVETGQDVLPEEVQPEEETISEPEPSYEEPNIYGGGYDPYEEVEPDDPPPEENPYEGGYDPSEELEEPTGGGVY